MGKDESCDWKKNPGLHHQDRGGRMQEKQNRTRIANWDHKKESEKLPNVPIKSV